MLGKAKKQKHVYPRLCMKNIRHFYQHILKNQIKLCKFVNKLYRPLRVRIVVTANFQFFLTMLPELNFRRVVEVLIIVPLRLKS